MPLTPEAKKLLAETIRGTHQDAEKGLRGRLLRAIHDEADRRYRLSVRVQDAGLDEAHRRRRERIEAWIDEHARATKPKNEVAFETAKLRLLAQAEKEAAATLINRVVLLRQLEAAGLSKPAVVTGGWNSKGYREFREFATTLCTNGTTDVTEGYAVLLQLLFDELATDLPGLFGDVGLTRLFPIPAATLREVIERLDDPDLASAWMDDTTLGWVYQYWNDPDREALDAKINGGGKIAPHEIASKTQMFTERYMVEWLLQNSLGLTWLCMCKKHGWTPDADGVLPILEARRVAWRAKRDAGEVTLDALMPIEGELEDHWKYYVSQPIPEDGVKTAPDSLRSLKLLDPAVGSGHFLVIAFGLLASLYREEARHRGQAITDREIAESILENNLHGIDIDPRAIQIAAAGLYLKAKAFAKDARPKTVNLVAPMLHLGNLPSDDPAVVQLRAALWNEAGIPEDATAGLLQALAGVDYLGSLLKVDATVDDALRAAEKFQKSTVQREIFDDGSRHTSIKQIGERQTILGKLEAFLAAHSKSEDLGLRLDGEQLEAGVRFVRMAKEGAYDVVVGNPPYQGLSKTEAFGYVTKQYPRGRADLYAAFLERGLEFVRAGGTSALITMRAWMFLGQFVDLRRYLTRECRPRAIVDLHFGAFSEMKDVSAAMSVLQAAPSDIGTLCIAIRPVESAFVVRDLGQPARNISGLLVPFERYQFDPRAFEVIEGDPILYWWTSEFLARYAEAPKLGQRCAALNGLSTQNNVRFVRKPWEVSPASVWISRDPDEIVPTNRTWFPYIKGGEGTEWFEPLSWVVPWSGAGLGLRVFLDEYQRVRPGGFVKHENRYFKLGIAFTVIGNAFSARAHSVRSIFGHMGSSLFPETRPELLCLLNSKTSRFVLQSLNPTVHFLATDVNRLPMFPVADAQDIWAVTESSWTEHERTREPSVEFRRPGPSAWSNTQAWAQSAVDRVEGEPLLPCEAVFDPVVSEDSVSFAIGVALGRFGVNGEGTLDIAPTTALPSGVLFATTEQDDSLDHPACAPIHAAWAEHGAAVAVGEDLRTYLRKSFFDYHKRLYENRPIYFPISSAKKNFVAFASIHRFTRRFGHGHVFGDGGRYGDDAFSALLADHLVPTKRRLEGELEDLRTARAAGTNKGKAEKRFNDVQKLLEELNDFIAKVSEVAERGPPPPDDKTPKREVDVRYEMDLDDGVMVNSAALWPLLEPQWKDPKKWWRELASSEGKKDYDWSHLAARYFPKRVRKKCEDDPSLAVAHKSFWELHPARAYAWELRLQDEIRPAFTIDEPGSDVARTAFLGEHEREASEILANEMKRRARKAAKVEEESEAETESGPLFDTIEDSEVAESSDA